MEIEKFLQFKQPDKALMALDVSKNRIGIAVSNPNLTIAFPKTVIIRTKLLQDLEHIKGLINKYNIWGLVVGLPLNSNGTKSTITQSINAFIKNLSSEITLPVITQDERYSTFFIKNNPALNNKKNNNALLDDQSACWVLQNFLDSVK